MSTDQPDYTVYRSRRFSLASLRKRLRVPRPGRHRPGRREAPPSHPRRPPWRRVLKWVGIWALGWVGLSIVLFMISAQISSSRIDSSARQALSNSGNPLTGPTTILVLGSDKRKGEAGRGRSDTLLLWRFDGGRSSKLSIPRDTRVTIPGFGADKINAAFAVGGAALTIETIEFNFPPIKINHLIVVNFGGFSDLVDALGGVKMTFGRCIVSRFEGRTLRVSKGTHKLDGRTALGVVRTRKNDCAPTENDLTRAKRQQQFLDAVKSRLKSPLTFIRLPWASWAAPGAFESDMKGPGLLSLFLEMERAGLSNPHILPVVPSGFGTSLKAKDPEYKAVIQRFLRAK